MKYERLVHDYRPFEILYQVRDMWGKWGNWRLHSAHSTDDERDRVIADLEDTENIRYRIHMNESEYDGQLDAKARCTKTSKLDSSGLKESEGVDPALGVVSLKDGGLAYWREL
jgi:hypothetical protein